MERKLKLVGIFFLAVVFSACGSREEGPRPKKAAAKPKKIDRLPISPMPEEGDIELRPNPELPENIKLVYDCLRDNRRAFRRLENTIGRLNYNVSFEEKAYVEMRISGRSVGDPACLRTVRRKYYFIEFIGKGKIVRQGLMEKDNGLLEIYDETQIRNLNLETVKKKIKELNERLRDRVEKSFQEFMEIVGFLDGPSYTIPNRDWAIGDSDEFMGYKK